MSTKKTVILQNAKPTLANGYASNGTTRKLTLLYSVSVKIRNRKNGSQEIKIIGVELGKAQVIKSPLSYPDITLMERVWKLRTMSVLISRPGGQMQSLLMKAITRKIKNPVAITVSGLLMRRMRILSMPSSKVLCSMRGAN